MTSLGDIVAAIIAALNVDLGTFDLSESGQVLEGTYDEPPGSVAFACLPPARQVAAAQQCAGVFVLRTMQQEIRLWAPATEGTPANHVERARLLVDEATTAIDAARQTGGNPLWKCIRFQVGRIEPDDVVVTDPPFWAYATLTLEYTYRRQTGTGS